MSIEKHTLTENKSAGFGKSIACESAHEFAADFPAIFSGFCRYRPQSYSSERVEKLCNANRGANREVPSCPAQGVTATETPLGQRELLYLFLIFF
jgi:hypothetical protein